MKMNVNETVENAKFKAKKAKKFMEKNKDTIIFLLKISALFGSGFYFGYRVNDHSHTKLIKKYGPHIIAKSGAEGLKAYQDWIIDNVPEAIQLINNADLTDTDCMPYFLNRKKIKEMLEVLGVKDLEKFHKQYNKSCSN